MTYDQAVRILDRQKDGRLQYPEHIIGLCLQLTGDLQEELGASCVDVQNAWSEGPCVASGQTAGSRPNGNMARNH